jgi:hypothetical protein
VRRLPTSIAILLAIVAVTTLFTLVTSISSLAMPDGPQPGFAVDPQGLTPTPGEAPASETGSTVGIMWMGIVITVIVLLPLLMHRSMWQKQL